MLMQIVGWLATVLVFTAFFMKTMIPLRVAAIASNFVFITYGLLGIADGIFSRVLPILVLHVCLLPLNLIRLREVRRLIRRVEEASDTDSAIDSLIPYMTRRRYKKGEILFRKGDKAENFYYLQKGTVEIMELEKTLQKGTVFGEVGIFGPGSIRTAGIVCAERCEICSISKDQMLQLFFQNPKFGFFIVRLLANYAEDNVNKLIHREDQETT